MKKLLICICLLYAAPGLMAQILNDSIRNIYGPNTTLFLQEENIKYNKPALKPVDTLIHGIHNFNYVDRHQRKYQDLGIIGTPMRPVFYIPPDIIGRTSGFHSFDPYFVTPEQIKYYDTKSPYSRLFFVVGGRGRSIVDVEYSRNIAPNWNVGASIENMTADKQIGTAIRRGDRMSDATSYQFYTRYFTKNQKYQLLANFSRLGITIGESGGFRVPVNQNFERDTPIWFTNAFSREVRANLHLYHQYRVSDLVQLYHSIDRTTQNVSFEMPLSSVTRDYFESPAQPNATTPSPFGVRYNFPQDSTQTSDLSQFSFLKNEIGIKGDIESVFYNFYLKRRDIRYDNKYLDSWSPVENYAGFNLRNDFNEEMHMSAFGEYRSGGYYKIGGGFTFKYIEANIKRIQHAPHLIHEYYGGNHLIWNQNLSSVQSDNFYGAAHFKLPFLSFSPHINLHRVNNAIYFNHLRTPQQADGAARIFAPGFDLNLRFFRNIYFENHLIYSDISGSSQEVFQIPKLFINSRLYYGNSHFNNKLQLQIGVDMHYRSSYLAYGYEPVIQQFYLQNPQGGFVIPAYPLVDVFFNAKIGRARLFVKYNNVTQALELTSEYFATPFYFGQQAVIDFGVNWLFFD